MFSIYAENFSNFRKDALGWGIHWQDYSNNFRESFESFLHFISYCFTYKCD